MPPVGVVVQIMVIVLDLHYVLYFTNSCFFYEWRSIQVPQC